MNTKNLKIETGSDAICKPEWLKVGDEIHFEVTSEGVTGPQWIDKLTRHAMYLDKKTKNFLLSELFKPTSGITTKIVVFTGESIGVKNCHHERILKIGLGKGLQETSTETALLINKKFLGEDFEAMGIKRIVSMHKPIGFSRMIFCGLDTVNEYFLLSATGHYPFEMVECKPKVGMNPQFGFAFQEK